MNEKAKCVNRENHDKTILSNPLKVNKFKFESNGTMPKQTAVYIRCV